MSRPKLAVDIRGLMKRFGRSTAVDTVGLSIRPGSTLGLLGPNGAGKSTTLRMLMGMLRPTAGSINVLGRDLATEAAQIKQRVGYVPDANYAYRWMTVERVIRFCRPMYRHWNDDRCAELLDMFQLSANKKIGSLSKGMLAKLSLLLALSHEPDLLVLDEPLSGLDPIARDDFIEGVMRGICSGTQTILFSSHQLDEVSKLADDVAIMNHGRVLIHRPLDELLSSFKRVRAVLQDGRLPAVIPKGTIWQSVNRREWALTVQDVDDTLIDQLKSENSVDSIEVAELSLDELFRDFIRGDETPDDQRHEKAQCEAAEC
ncbi:MAG: ABC transporter ATP-binding protein [Planctomycetes bacterium]|nr:ABC transporter ATP-binding protein [Planctomycetota bacterium]MBL7038951.1 ABC transporter ATP-binding protein [Pirellulaceae bacterium]